ncbi:MAG: UDP-N-acetylmuramate--alanine ligase, partial [Verrucomicrobiota bacterium]
MTLASELNLRQMLTQERHRIHLIGVAGSGMSGIAALLLELGHDVSGSDKAKSWEVDRLQRLGLRFRAEHRAEDARDAELVIYSSAIAESNPIRAAAAASGQPLVRRAEALAAIMSGKRGIFVV